MLRIMTLFFALALGSAALAETVVDAEALAKLEGAAQWPVVDVRDLSERSRTPIRGALDFDAELRLSGPVLVVGSEDSIAQLTAVAIESRLPEAKAYAVAGGIESLRSIRPDLLPSRGSDNMPGTFTIPSDTCQPGEPLHTFSEPDKKEK